MTGIGPYMRAEREKHGLSVIEVARRLGVTRMAVYHWENPNSNPRMSSVLAYFRAVGVRKIVFDIEEEIS